MNTQPHRTPVGRLPLLILGLTLGCGGRSGLAVAGQAEGSGGAIGAGGAGGAWNPCDADADGHAAASCGGADCDDADPTRHPGAPDLNVGAGEWSSTQISGAILDDLRVMPSLAIDGSGAAHVSYVLEGLHYATNAGGAWTAALIDGSADRLSSLAVGEDGAVHIVYRAPGGLYYASHGDGMWTVEVVDPLGDGVPSIALASAGDVRVSYGAAGALRYAARAPGSWAIEEVDPIGGTVSSLALDAQGTAHVSYGFLEDDALRYATNGGGGWVIEVISEGTTAGSSIGLDRSGAAHVVFGGGIVYHATRTAGGWQSAPIEGTESNTHPPSLRVDGGGSLHFGIGVSNVHYVTNAGGDWTVEVLPFGWGPRLAGREHREPRPPQIQRRKLAPHLPHAASALRAVSLSFGLG